MKLIILTPLYPQIVNGKMNNHTKAIHYLISGWKALGIDIQVIHISLNPFKKIYKLPFLNKHLIRTEYEGIPILSINRQLFIPRTDILFDKQQQKLGIVIRKHLQSISFHPDIVIMHFPTLFSKLISTFDSVKKKIGVLHNIDIKYLNKKSILLRIIKLDKIGYRSNKINNFLQKSTGYTNTFPVYSGVPENLISSFQETSLKHYHFELVKILFVGRLDKNKNLSIILNSISQFHYNYIFKIIGDGPEKMKLLSLSKSLKIRDKCIFIEKMERIEVINEMKLSHLFIMISQSETFGLVYLEAMGQGCIVIATKGEGIDGIIKNGYNGFLVESDSPTQLFNLLLYIKTLSLEDRLTIAKNAISTVLNMTEKQMSDFYFSNVK
jgi:glycosyltransferase involved in cell wall biosynthesis